MESVFFKNMPEATVNRTNRKTKKNTKKNKNDIKQKKTKNKKKQRLWGNSGWDISLFFLFFLVVSCFFVFFVFLFNCAKSFLVELWADKRMQKGRSWGGASIYMGPALGPAAPPPPPPQWYGSKTYILATFWFIGTIHVLQSTILPTIKVLLYYEVLLRTT